MYWGGICKIFLGISKWLSSRLISAPLIAEELFCPHKVTNKDWEYRWRRIFGLFSKQTFAADDWYRAEITQKYKYFYYSREENTWDSSQFTWLLGDPESIRTVRRVFYSYFTNEIKRLLKSNGQVLLEGKE